MIVHASKLSSQQISKASEADHSTRLVNLFLPLDVDSINENDSVANPDPTPRIASVHKSRFAEVVLVGCWIEAVYYGLLLFTIT